MKKKLLLIFSFVFLGYIVAVAVCSVAGPSLVTGYLERVFDAPVSVGKVTFSALQGVTVHRIDISGVISARQVAFFPFFPVKAQDVEFRYARDAHNRVPLIDLCRKARRISLARFLATGVHVRRGTLVITDASLSPEYSVSIEHILLKVGRDPRHLFSTKVRFYLEADIAGRAGQPRGTIRGSGTGDWMQQRLEGTIEGQGIDAARLSPLFFRDLSPRTMQAGILQGKCTLSVKEAKLHAECQLRMEGMVFAKTEKEDAVFMLDIFATEPKDAEVSFALDMPLEGKIRPVISRPRVILR